MNLQNKALDLLGVSQWHVRGLQDLSVTPVLKRFVLLAEKQEQFSAAHREQLEKILDYLQLKNQCELIYADQMTSITQADLVLSFGAQISESIESNLAPCRTFSISEMLSNPACKRQVMNDIKTIKDYCT